MFGRLHHSPVSRTLPAVALSLLGVASCLLWVPALHAQERPADGEALIRRQLHNLDKLRGRTEQNAETRRSATRQLALEIRSLPASGAKVALAGELANLATEGDSGRDTLQEVTTTYSQALEESPDQSPNAYLEVARLARYENMHVSLDGP